MFRKLLKNKKAQNTAEYALLISLVVAAIIAMQTFAQRALQGRIRDAAAGYMVQQTNGLGATSQYEPYYLTSNDTVSSSMSETQVLGNGVSSKLQNDVRTREAGSFSTSSYDNSINGINTGI